MDDARFGLDRRIKLAGPLKLDSGAFIAPLEVAYETYGELNAAKSNAILVCHALTGDQHVASNHPITGKPGWWTRAIGQGKPIDTARSEERRVGKEERNTVQLRGEYGPLKKKT